VTEGRPVLAYRVDGEGEPLLLLNGGMMTISSWDPVATSLAEHCRVIRCDLRGQLLSPGPAPADLAGHADDVAALLDHLGLATCDVLGTSFGGEVGLLLGATHSACVHSLVAVTVGDHLDAGGLEGSRRLREACREALAGGDRGLLFRLLMPITYSEAYLEANREALAARQTAAAALPDAWFAGVAELLCALEAFDLRPLLPRIACPTLVVTAGGDRILPPERGRAVAAAIPGSRHVEVPESGHALVVEHPDRLVELVLSFLAEVGAGR
jgi:3-oxoadipate enol-lactonase